MSFRPWWIWTGLGLGLALYICWYSVITLFFPWWSVTRSLEWQLSHYSQNSNICLYLYWSWSLKLRWSVFWDRVSPCRLGCPQTQPSCSSLLHAGIRGVYHQRWLVKPKYINTLLSVILKHLNWPSKTSKSEAISTRKKQFWNNKILQFIYQLWEFWLHGPKFLGGSVHYIKIK